MQRWMTIAIGLALACALACSKTSDDKAKTGAEPTTATKGKDSEDGKADLDALAKLKDEMCACKDKACGEAVDAKLAAKSKEMQTTYADSRNKNIMHYAMESEMAARECLMKLK